VPARHARAAVLARPAAARVAAVIASADRPLSPQEVAETLGRHHTAVRTQIAALERVGVVEGATDRPAGRGRPARRYAPVPDPAEREAMGHRELVRLLMGLVRETGLGPEEMERFGEAQGRSVTVPGGGVDELRQAFARLGFAPRASGTPGELVLEDCPFADAVEAAGGELICLLHRGLARGIAARADPEMTIEELVVRKPRRAGCRLRLTRRAAPSPPSTAGAVPSPPGTPTREVP
jgi:predicted ArsR family transcriptional regulator